MKSACFTTSLPYDQLRAPQFESHALDTRWAIGKQWLYLALLLTDRLAPSQLTGLCREAGVGNYVAAMAAPAAAAAAAAAAGTT